MPNDKIESLINSLSNLEKKAIKSIKFKKNAKNLVKKFVHKVFI